LEEEVNALEEVDECIIARRNISYSLRKDIMRNRDMRAGGRLTPRRTPIPVKIVLAGESG
jgi:hypothetical protein